jgi:molecular chaperone Hsp33
MTDHSDAIRKFMFEDTHIRGELVRLDNVYRTILSHDQYPLPVAALLGEALAASALLASTIKYDGSLILQVQGNGPQRLTVAQCTSDRTLRGLARWDGAVAVQNFAQQVGEGQMVITIEPKMPNQERYQGVVALATDSLAATVDHYFAQSAQLETRVWLAADEARATGMLLQRLPGDDADPDAWNRILHLGATIADKELMELDSEEIIRRLFHEEDVRLFDVQPLRFRCGCSRERVENTLRALGRDELYAILAEQGSVETTCEFCGRRYVFDRVDVDRTLSGNVVAPESSRRH